MKYFLLPAFFTISMLLLPFDFLYAVGSTSSPQAEAQLIAIVPTTDGVGREVAVQLFLSTEGKSVNALSGNVEIFFHADQQESSSSPVTISRIHDGDSIVLTWVTKATTNNSMHVSFSGIIPGGITTVKGKVMTLYFIPKQQGTLNLTLTGTVFENGASGVSHPLRPNTLSIPVRKLSQETITAEPKDTTPPREIKATIYQNEGMFDGKPFVVINAKDSESGIATYELLEIMERHPVETLITDSSLPWRFVDNPAPLLSMGEASFVYLRVTDHDGNATVVEVSHPIELSPEKGKSLFNKLLISAILIGVAGLFLWLWSRRRKHHVQ